MALVAAPGLDEAEVLRLAASVERASEHPLARAIVEAATERGIALAEVTDFDSPTGKGVVGTVAGRKVALGHAGFLGEFGISAAALEARAERLRQDGATVVYLAVDGQARWSSRHRGPGEAEHAGSPRRADRAGHARGHADRRQLRPPPRRWRGHSASREVEAEVLPDRKSAVVERLRRDGRVVAMAGDGVNDAPALAAADVGIAMGTGTDVAIESAGVTLLKGDLTGIVRARRLSAATMRNIRQNLFFAFIYNAAGIPIAAGVLYPTFGILLSPVLARRRHGALLGQRGRQCAAAAADPALAGTARARRAWNCLGYAKKHGERNASTLPSVPDNPLLYRSTGRAPRASMSTLSAFLSKQRMRWYRRGIDRRHHLRRQLAYYVAVHDFEIGDYSQGDPIIRFYNKSRLKVGKYCSIAASATFVLGGRHRTDTVTSHTLQPPAHGHGPPQGDIVLGSDVWIAADALILSGVTIGDGAVVGAGAVVLNDIPPYGLAFGNPARIFGKRFSDDLVAELTSLRWWDFDEEQIETLRPLLLGTDIELFVEECRKLKGLPPRARTAVGKDAPAGAAARDGAEKKIAMIGGDQPGSGDPRVVHPVSCARAQGAGVPDRSGGQVHPAGN